MKGLYNIAKEMVDLKFGDSINCKSFFVCALYGILCKYSKYTKEICNLFLFTDIFMEYNSIEQILIKHNIDVEYEEIEDDENSVSGVSNQGIFYFVNNNRIYNEKRNPFIICNLNNLDLETMLNVFCHEFGHLVKSMINGNGSFSINDGEEIYYLRTGLNHLIYRYDSNDNDIVQNNYYAFLDECINTIQTTDVMEEIISLLDMDIDEDVYDLLKTLNKDKLKNDCGYEKVVGFVRKLWDVESFRNIVEENIVDNPKAIISQINFIMNDESGFDNIASTIDNLAELLYFSSNCSQSDIQIQIDTFTTLLEELVNSHSKVKEKIAFILNLNWNYL